MSVIVLKNFITKDICQQLNEWVDERVYTESFKKGVSRGEIDYEYRYTTRFSGADIKYPKVVYDVKNKISNTLEIQDLKNSATGGYDGIVVSCTFNEGDTYEHIDPNEGSLEVLRCNVLSRKPANGGVLFINGEEIELDVGDLHCYLPSTVPHYVTKTVGETSRVLWMFGYQCSIERFNEINGATK